MKVYKLDGKARCTVCGGVATLYVDVLDTPICRKCGVEMYRELGTHFVPRAVPNVILRTEKDHRPLSAPLYEKVEKADRKMEEGSDTVHAPFKTPKSPNFKTSFKHKKSNVFKRIRRNK